MDERRGGVADAREGDTGPGIEPNATNERLDALAQLAGGVAHDLNNLLAVSLGVAEQLARSPRLDEEARAAASAIVDSTRRAADLVARLMRSARRQTPGPTLVDVNAVVTDVSGLLGRVLDAGVRIELDLRRDAPDVRADAALIEQCVMNLMLNARRAMPEGGTMRVSTRCGEGGQGFDGAKIEGPCVLIAVADTGTGMSAETRAHLFEPFFTTRPPGLGTGLGLASVRRWLRGAGGVIDVDTALGRGTTFTIALPAA